MTALTLKSLHAYLRLLENGPELKRRMPVAGAPRTMPEGLVEMSRLVGLDPGALKDEQAIAALIGAQRFVMIGGTPSVTDQVAQVFDSSKVLWTVLIEPGHFENAALTPNSPMTGRRAPAPAAGANEFPGGAPPRAEASPDTLKAMLAGNVTLACQLFRVLFEHMLGFTSLASLQQGNVLLVSELTGSREHSRSFLSTALFVLGAEVDRNNLLPFMKEQGLFGIPSFEHMLRGRNYCEAYYTFRRLERAFIGTPAEEARQLSHRIAGLLAQYGGEPAMVTLLEPEEADKLRVDACLAATDLLEALALTPWCVSLRHAVALGSSNCVRSIKTIARQFEQFANGVATLEKTNREIADHLLAFARQFSADCTAP